MIVPADAVSYQEKPRIVIQKSHHVTLFKQLTVARTKPLIGSLASSAYKAHHPRVLSAFRSVLILTCIVHVSQQFYTSYTLQLS